MTGTLLPDYDSPEDFLADLDFQPLVEMVLHAYTITGPHMMPILFSPDGNQMPDQTTRGELRWLRKFVRNAIAHHRMEDHIFDLNDFNKAAVRTERVLLALRYNVPPALARHELKRLGVVDGAVRRLGGSSLQELFKAINAL